MDLDGDGLELRSAATSSIRLDVNGDGALDRVGWVAADDGVLAYDRNANGRIDGFDEVSFIDDLIGAETDIEGLLGLDDNADGIISADDAVWAELLVWQDSNQDGISDPAELRTLDEAGVTEIDLARMSTDETIDEASDNAVLNTTTFTMSDGTEGAVGDVAFSYQAVLSSLFDLDPTTTTIEILDQFTGSLIDLVPDTVDSPVEQLVSLGNRAKSVFDEIFGQDETEGSIAEEEHVDLAMSELQSFGLFENILSELTSHL